MTYRIPLQDISDGGSTAQFGVQWEARIPVAISFIDDDPGLAFHTRFVELRPGDQVTVCAFDEKEEGKWREGNAPLREMAVYRIVEKTPLDLGVKASRIMAVRVGAIFEVPRPNPAEMIDGVVALDIVPSGQNIYQVRDRQGNVIEQFMGKDGAEALKQAEEFRDREQKRSGVVGLSMRKGFGKFFVCKPDGVILAEFMTKTEAESFMRSGGQKAA